MCLLQLCHELLAVNEMVPSQCRHILVGLIITHIGFFLSSLYLSTLISVTSCGARGAAQAPQMVSRLLLRVRLTSCGCVGGRGGGGGGEGVLSKLLSLTIANFLPQEVSIRVGLSIGTEAVAPGLRVGETNFQC